MAFNQDANEFHWLMDMLESVEVGLVVLDLDFHVQAWNGFMEHHSGITASQIRDKVLFEVFPDIPEAFGEPAVDQQEEVILTQHFRAQLRLLDHRDLLDLPLFQPLLSALGVRVVECGMQDHEQAALHLLRLEGVNVPLEVADSNKVL